MDGLRTFYVVRHAKAGDREEWSGDDRKRPLTAKGRRQAEALVGVLAALPVSQVFSSPYRRCVQTVEPLARARGLAVERKAELAEGHGLSGLRRFLADPALDRVVLGTHGDVVWELVEDLLARRVADAGDGGYEKASTWILEVDARGVAAGARYVAAP